MWFKRKLNPAQILMGGSTETSTEPTYNYIKQYESIEIVNRAVNLVVDGAAEIPCIIGERLGTPTRGGVKRKTVETILNFSPNPFQDISSFRRNLILDLIINGNIFIYFDGAHLYQLPAAQVTIETDTKTYVKCYRMGNIEYAPDEVIHIKENSFNSIYRGISRLKPATSSMGLLQQMRKFQHNFFKNGAVPGLIIKSPDVLSQKIKERMLEFWKIHYRPDGGGRSPLFLDGGLSINNLGTTDFKELDFQTACLDCEKTILKAIGVPPILFDGGNNANIAPNHRLFYIETIIPICKKLNSAFSRYFGYQVNSDVTSTPALQPALRDQAAYISTLVNGGILTPNEGRTILGKEELEGHSEIRVPANIAGSAVDPSLGGAPGGESNE